MIKSFGLNLKKIRTGKNIFQAELAFKCKMEISQVSRIERGVINTSISTVFVIAEVLNISPKDLFDF